MSLRGLQHSLSEHDGGRLGGNRLDFRKFEKQLLDLSLLTGTSTTLQLHDFILSLGWKRTDTVGDIQAPLRPRSETRLA